MASYNIPKKFAYNNTNPLYRPWFHVNTNQGKINNITCIYKKSGWYYLFFDHQLNFHRPKSWNVSSLAVTNDFYSFQYHYEVISSSNKDQAISNVVAFNQGHNRIFYLKSNLSKSHCSLYQSDFDFNKLLTSNEKLIFSYEDFLKQYDAKIVAINVFRRLAKNYLIVSAVSVTNVPIIFIFKIGLLNKPPELVKRIFFKKLTGAVIAINAIFKNQKVYCFFSNKASNKNNIIYRSFYAVISQRELLKKDHIFIELFNEIDVSDSFGGIQLYKKFRRNYLVGCFNDNQTFKAKEITNKWCNVLSCMRQLRLNKFDVNMRIDDQIHNAILNNSYPMTAYANVVIDKENATITISDSKKQWIELIINDNRAKIISHVAKRNGFVKQFVGDAKIDYVQILVDVSIVEINVNGTCWFSTRCYFQDQIKIEQK